MARPVKYAKALEIKDIASKHFKECDDKDIPYTLTGVCIALGIHRDTFATYAKDPKFSDTIKEIRQKVENWLEINSLTGKTNPTVSIFNLKNNFGWKDKTETEISNKEGESFKIKAQALDEDEIDARILELMNKK